MAIPTSLADLKATALKVLLIFIAMRMLTGGLLGGTLSTVFAGVAASVARSKPGLVPAALRPAFEPLQAAARTRGGSFAAAALVDLVGAAMVAAPGWVRYLAGGAGFAPICAFTVAYLFPKMTPLVALSSLEASGVLPPALAAFFPTSLLAWGMHHGFIPRSAVEAAHGSIMRAVKLVAGRVLAM